MKPWLFGLVMALVYVALLVGKVSDISSVISLALGFKPSLSVLGPFHSEKTSWLALVRC
jgi:hypothetical protein